MTEDHNKMKCHLVIILEAGLFLPDNTYHLFWYRHDAENFAKQWIEQHPCDDYRIIEKIVIN